MGIFVELSIVIAVAAGLAVVMKLLKQPLLVGYILTGIIVGPQFLHVLESKEHIELFSKIGITILLFIVGLSLSPKVIKEVGKVSLVTGLGQVLFTSIIGFLIAILLGIDKIAAIYISIALTFSSTIIILKLLTDKGDLNKLYGKISVGFLLVQDIVATVILVLVSSFAGAEESSLVSTIAFILIKGFWLMLILYIVTTYIIPRFSRFLASSQELLFLFTIAWGLGLSSIFYAFGFSIEIGALVAGVAFSLTPFADGIASRLKPLRDFFIVLFFILLGSEMVLDTIPQILMPALVMSLFVLVGNPIIVVILMNLLGYKRKTGFQAGLTVAQISEFSLILATLGYNVGHLNRETLSLVTLVGLITIAGSTYFILYSEQIYSRVEGLLKFLELKKNKRGISMNAEVFDIILFGFDRVGRDFLNAFSKLEKNYMVVDFNPELITQLEQQQVPFKYGDAEDVEFLHELNLSSIKMCVSTIPYVKVNSLLIKKIREHNKHTIIIVVSHEIDEAIQLYELGATYVVMPHYLGAKYAGSIITRLGFDRKGFDEEKEKHITHLQKHKHTG